MHDQEATKVYGQAIDLRAVAIVGLVILPFHLWRLLGDALYSWQYVGPDALTIRWFAIEMAQQVTGHLIESFGIASAVVSVGAIAQWGRARFDAAALVRVIALTSIVWALVYAAQDTLYHLAVHDYPSDDADDDNPLRSALRVTAMLAAATMSGWLYIRCRRPIDDAKTPKRFLVLLAFALIAWAPRIYVEFETTNNLMLMAKPGDLDASIPYQVLSTLGMVLATGLYAFGRVFLFGLMGIAVLKRMSREHDPTSVVLVALSVAAASWFAWYGFGPLQTDAFWSGKAPLTDAFREQFVALLWHLGFGALAGLAYFASLHPAHATRLVLTIRGQETRIPDDEV